MLHDMPTILILVHEIRPSRTEGRITVHVGAQAILEPKVCIHSEDKTVKPAKTLYNQTTGQKRNYGEEKRTDLEKGLYPSLDEG